MKLVLFAVGRLKAGPETDLAARYLDRLKKAGPAIGIEFARTVEITESRAPSVAARKEEEGRALLQTAQGDSILVLLDETGKAMDSGTFAALLGQTRDDGRKTLVVAIGGADGHGDLVRARADHLVSFGRMTWPHQLVRIMAAEQLYRAVTILSGHPYHRN